MPGYVLSVQNLLEKFSDKLSQVYKYIINIKLQIACAYPSVNKFSFNKIVQQAT